MLSMYSYHYLRLKTKFIEVLVKRSETPMGTFFPNKVICALPCLISGSGGVLLKRFLRALEEVLLLAREDEEGLSVSENSA